MAMISRLNSLVIAVVATAVLGAAVAFWSLGNDVFAAKQPKVEVCHGANLGGYGYGPDTPHTIAIAGPAVLAHLAHGDSLGACA